MFRVLLTIFALIAIGGCTTAPTFTGSSFFGYLPPCANGVRQWCEGTEVYYLNGRKHVDITEYGASADKYQPAGYSLKSKPGIYYFLWCGIDTDRESTPIRCSHDELKSATSFSDIQHCWTNPSDECRKARDYARDGRYTLHRQRLNDNILAAKKKAAAVSAPKVSRSDKNSTDVTKSLETCDSFGYERGTQAHADCAMKLYMNEQGKGSTTTPANTARKQAIATARQREQKRIQDLEASLRLMQIGADLMTGKRSTPTQSKTYTQTYNINGQIISCTTTGSITTCL